MTCELGRAPAAAHGGAHRRRLPHPALGGGLPEDTRTVNLSVGGAAGGQRQPRQGGRGVGRGAGGRRPARGLQAEVVRRGVKTTARPRAPAPRCASWGCPTSSGTGRALRPREQAAEKCSATADGAVHGPGEGRTATADERKLLRPAELLDGRLAPERRRAILGRREPHQLHRAAASACRRRRDRIVSLDPRGEVVGRSGVERAVSAAARGMRTSREGISSWGSRAIAITKREPDRQAEDVREPPKVPLIHRVVDRPVVWVYQGDIWWSLWVG